MPKLNHEINALLIKTLETSVNNADVTFVLNKLKIKSFDI